MKRVVPMLKSLAAAASVSIATCDSVLFVMCCQKSAGFRVSDGEGPRVGRVLGLILNRPSVVSCEADLCGEREGAGAEEVLTRGMGIAPRRRRPQGLS